MFRFDSGRQDDVDRLGQLDEARAVAEIHSNEEFLIALLSRESSTSSLTEIS